MDNRISMNENNKEKNKRHFVLYEPLWHVLRFFVSSIFICAQRFFMFSLVLFPIIPQPLHITPTRLTALTRSHGLVRCRDACRRTFIRAVMHPAVKQEAGVVADWFACCFGMADFFRFLALWQSSYS